MNSFPERPPQVQASILGGAKIHNTYFFECSPASELSSASEQRQSIGSPL